MAGVSGGGAVSASGKKSLDAELNLVPFIDLLSMCICFLLMTAVWMQVASLQVKQAKGTEAVADDPHKLELGLRFLSPDSIELVLKKKGGAVKKSKVTVAKFSEDLEAFIRPFPGAIASAMITPAQGVSYGVLVATMDQLRSKNIVNLGVVPVGDR